MIRFLFVFVVCREGNHAFFGHHIYYLHRPTEPSLGLTIYAHLALPSRNTTVSPLLSLMRLRIPALLAIFRMASWELQGIAQASSFFYDNAKFLVALEKPGPYHQQN
jgi:hypothetical protein